MYLVGDIGGTKTNLAWAQMNGPSFSLSEVQTFDSNGYKTFSEVVQAFLKLAPPTSPMKAACFGVAGPVDGNACRTTNFPWIIDGSELSQAFGGIPVRILNDLEALGYALDSLGEDDLLILNKGEEKAGNRALIAAGTGLGEALCIWDGARYIVSPSEGGHCSFSPHGPLQMGLLKSLEGIYGHVSVERVVSGLGIMEIFNYLGRRGVPAHPEVLAALEGGQGAAAVAGGARRGDCPRSAEAIALFIDAYGVEASNMALKGMARGGVYIGGGIAPKLKARFQDGAFMKAYLKKGRFKELVASMPVKLILNPLAPLLGSAKVASEASS